MIETREYPVPLTDEELKTTADYVGLIHKSIQDRENAFAEVRQEYKAAIKELRSGLAMQLEKLSSRREVREVELEIVFNSPEKGMKQIYLNSTGQLIDTLEMTDEDEQDLFAGTEEAEPEQICDKCGAVAPGNRVLKLDRDRKLCLICTARANDKKWAAVMAWHKAGHQVLFRACYWKGVTKFTFMEPVTAGDSPYTKRVTIRTMEHRQRNFIKRCRISTTSKRTDHAMLRYIL